MLDQKVDENIIEKLIRQVWNGYFEWRGIQVWKEWLVTVLAIMYRWITKIRIGHLPNLFFQGYNEQNTEKLNKNQD